LFVGSETEEPDIELLFTIGEPLALMQLSALSDRIGALLEASVDLVPYTSASPPLRDRILAKPCHCGVDDQLVIDAICTSLRGLSGRVQIWPYEVRSTPFWLT